MELGKVRFLLCPLCLERTGNGGEFMNKELAKKVIKWVEEHPEQWDQNTFIYVLPGTDITVEGWMEKVSACLAGWTVLLSGYLPQKSGGWPAQEYAAYIYDEIYVTGPDGTGQYGVPDLAHKLLDLGTYPAEYLFYMYHQPAVLERFKALVEDDSE
jgi:hypothetical protein